MESNQLIPLLEDEIDDELINTVDARYLHTFLEVNTQFSIWIQRRIEEYGFEINIDYLLFPKTGEKSGRGRPADEYHLTLDMAKELAMVERNEKGRQARQYFIRCEKEFRKLTGAQIEFTGKEVVQLMDLERKGSRFARQKLFDLGMKEADLPEKEEPALEFFAALDKLLASGKIINYSQVPDKIYIRILEAFSAIKEHLGQNFDRKDFALIKLNSRFIESKSVKNRKSIRTIKVWIFTPYNSTPLLD